jgi:hypothetical protein
MAANEVSKTSPSGSDAALKGVSLDDLMLPKISPEIVAHDVKVLRSYYLEQLPKLREIAYVALEADGRSGWSASLASAYTRGVWDLWTKENGANLALDLRSGELRLAHGGSVAGSGWYEVREVAPDSEVAKIIMRPLNVAMLLEDLRRMAAQPYASYYKAEDQEERKLEYRERLKKNFP